MRSMLIQLGPNFLNFMVKTIKKRRNHCQLLQRMLSCSPHFRILFSQEFTMPGIERYRALGLCLSCGDARAPGRVRGHPCLKKAADTVHKSMKRAKARGKCTRCFLANDNLPKNYCV